MIYSSKKIGVGLKKITLGLRRAFTARSLDGGSAGRKRGARPRRLPFGWRESTCMNMFRQEGPSPPRPVPDHGRLGPSNRWTANVDSCGRPHVRKIGGLVEGLVVCWGGYWCSESAATMHVVGRRQGREAVRGKGRPIVCTWTWSNARRRWKA